MKTDRKPPLPRSPMKIRTRQALRPVNTPLQTPSGGSTPKSQMKGTDGRLENSTMTCDLKALAKMVQDELGVLSAKAALMNGNNINSSVSTSLFERGRLYDAYSARRNERLQKKKQNETADQSDEPKSAYNLGVKNDSTKKKKSVGVASNSSVDRSQHHRYSLRSSTKKPPLPPVPMDVDETTTTTVGKRGGSRTRRK